MAAPGIAAVNARSLRAHGLVGPANSITEGIVRAAGIYGTSPTSHLGLAARLDGYRPGELERQRIEERSIMRTPGPRGSVFLAPRELVPAFLGLSRPRTARRVLLNEGLSEVELERLMDRVESGLAGTSLSAKELRERMGATGPGGTRMTLVLRTMVGEGRAVAAESIGGQRATAYRYARMAEWAPDVGPPLPPEKALAVMAPLWMRANGPGTVDDLAWWAGVTKRLARAAMADMGARMVEVEGLDGEQWATDEITEELAGAEPTGTVRFLPVWDAWLMSRRERSRVLDTAHEPFVVDRSGNVTNTVTLDGRVVGVWDEDGDTLLVAMLEGDAPEGLEAAARLRPIIDWSRIELVDPRPLPSEKQNAFRMPIRPG
ncbi:MAG: winged helix DNA-binding domain-containing protein [Candidatus Limnocylindrales bacterium]